MKGEGYLSSFTQNEIPSNLQYSEDIYESLPARHYIRGAEVQN